MAKKSLTTRVALEGGDEVRKGLERLGDAGKTAFDNLQKATAKADR